MKLIKTIIFSLFFLFFVFLFPAESASAQGKIVHTRSFHTQSVETLTGNFQSLMGVMNNLSCYCYNTGYLTLDEETKIAVCFKDVEEKIRCTRLKVIGSYENVAVDPDPQSPCSEGTRKIFMVKSYECLD